MDDNGKKRLVKIGGGFAKDGQSILLRLTQADGTTTQTVVPIDSAFDLVSYIEEQTKLALDRQEELSKGVDRRLVYPLKPKRVTRLRGATATDQTPLLTIELDGRMQLDIALRGIDVRALIEWLEGLEEASQSPPTKPS